MLPYCILSILMKTLDSYFLTQKTCQFIGFLLFDGFVVQCFKEDIQNQNVITVNREKSTQFQVPYLSQMSPLIIHPPVYVSAQAENTTSEWWV